MYSAYMVAFSNILEVKHTCIFHFLITTFVFMMREQSPMNKELHRFSMLNELWILYLMFNSINYQLPQPSYSAGRL